MTKGSPDFKMDAWQRIVARVCAEIPGFTADAAEVALRAVRADRPRTVNRLDRYLQAHDHGLRRPVAECPAVVVRFTVHLAAAGHTDVRPLACSRCRQQVILTRCDHEWVCAPCLAEQRAFPCVRCGAMTTRTGRRLPEGRICGSCYAKDPLAKRKCRGCGKMARPTRRLDDGSGVLCQTCAPRPQHVCIRCSRTRPAHSITDDGPLCSRCYTRTTLSWNCAFCGATRIRQSGAPLGPHACLTCRRTHLRHAPPPAPHVPAGQASAAPPLRKRPATMEACVFCGRSRRVSCRWPAGPVCKVCAVRSRTYPAQCARCSQAAVLVGLDADRQRICGPCAGWSVDYRCRRCAQPGVRAHGLCSTCVTADDLQAAFANPDGQIAAQLRPLVEALGSAPDPRSVTVWLGKSGAAAMLRDLAVGDEPISHQTLDSLSPSRHADYLREILIRTGILEPRNHYLDRLGPWIDQYLRDVPDQHAQLVGTYAHWYLLHRARRRKGPLPNSSAARIRTRVRVAHQFLVWTEEHGHQLGSLRQDIVDSWLVGGQPGRYEIRPFLHWAHQRGLLAAGIYAPARKPEHPSVFLDESRQLEQVHQCLTDTSMAIDLRAGGALALLYGLNLTRVLAITASQLHDDGSGSTSLQLGQHRLLLPPILADLLAALPVTRPRSTLPMSVVDPGYLFPGRTPARPVDAGMFGQRLKQHGISFRGGRNTALISLAAELPAAVLADLLAVDIITATRWAGYAKRDWHLYISHRRG